MSSSAAARYEGSFTEAGERLNYVPQVPQGPRRGGWILTYTGRQFWPLDPRPEDVDPRDIAHALAHLCRYAGHTSTFYSVAQHCVILSEAVAPEHAAWALLHDAAEAYIVDLPRPLKRELPAYAEVEALVERAIAERFGLDWPCPPEVKDADTRILLDERDVLFAPSPYAWAMEERERLGVRVEPWSPKGARAAYRRRLLDLGVCDDSELVAT